jgi:hypothetical protein
MRTISKILLAIALFIFILSETNAQTRRRLTSDFHVGLNMATMDIEGANMDKVIKLGVQVGANVNYKILGNVQLQTGFYISKRGLAQDIKRRETDPVLNIVNVTETKERTAAAYIQMPFCLGYEVYLSDSFAFNLNGGVYGAYGFRGKRSTEGFQTLIDPDGSETTTLYGYEESETFEIRKWQRLDYGLIGKVGLIYDVYTVNVGYEYGLANAFDGSQSVLKNRNMTISFGFRF